MAASRFTAAPFFSAAIHDQIASTSLNTNTRTAFDGYKGEFYVWAQSIVNPKAFQLLGSERFEFSLPPRGTHSLDTQEVTAQWDRTGVRHGTKCDSWVPVVRDSADKVVLKKASAPTWLPVADRMKDVSNGQLYDRQLKPVQGR